MVTQTIISLQYVTNAIGTYFNREYVLAFRREVEPVWKVYD